MSVNVGKPVSSQWRGATVTSAIVKQLVSGRVAVRGVNLVGDAQADRTVHGGPRKAVYAYPSKHYAWWANEFGVTADAWGFVGENLTVVEIDEADVAFGDIVCAGSVHLVVTEPRGPCYKLGMRVGSDDAPVRMLQSGRMGFYLGVVEEGELRAGDEVICYDGAVTPRVSIAELCAAFATPSTVDDERLTELTELPGLDAEWREHFERERDRRDGPAAVPPARRQVTASAVERLAHDVVQIELEPADGVPLGPHEAGQFLPLLIPLDGEEHVRCYSLLDPPVARRWRIAVRESREDTGKPSVSRWLHRNVKPGLTIDARDPAGTFTLSGIPAERQVTLIAGGIGVTPMLALARELADCARAFSLFLGVRGEDEVLFEDDLRVLVHRPSCLDVHLFYPGAQTRNDGLRRTDSPIIPMSALRSAAAGDDQFYVCGPPAMQAAIVDGLMAWDVPEPRIRLEFFGSAPAVTVPAVAQEVVFDRCARAVLWSDPATTLLDLANQHGIEIPYACRSGSCATCAVRLLAGSVGYVRTPSAPVAPRTCLTCIAYPLEATVLDA